MGGGVCVEVGEEEVWERLDQFDRCLVGWWGKGSSQIPEVDSMRRWAISQWSTNESFAVVKMGRGLWIFEFESKKEVDRVLMFGRRRFGANLVHLRKWGQDLGCSSYENLEEKAWVRIVGLLVHLWSRKILEKIGDVCGGFLAVDEGTKLLIELCWARVLVRLGESEPPKVVEVIIGGLRFRIQLWWEFSPSLKVDSSQSRGESLESTGMTMEEHALGRECA